MKEYKFKKNIDKIIQGSNWRMGTIQVKESERVVCLIARDPLRTISFFLYSREQKAKITDLSSYACLANFSITSQNSLGRSIRISLIISSGISL